MSAFSMLASILIAGFDVPMPAGSPPLPVVISEATAKLPIGKWRVEYANGITEVCVVEKNGEATILDPVRIGGGKGVVSGGAILFLFENGRAQRWTAVGNRFVVEHWFPGTKFPTTSAGVLGVAELAK